MALATHGGDIFGAARRLGVPLSRLIDFSANVSPLGLSPKAERRLKRDFLFICHYPDQRQEELRRLVASRERINPDCILFGNGATQLLHLIPRCLKPKKALLAQPSFAEYHAALQSSACKISEFRLRPETGFQLDARAFLRTLELEQPDLIILGNPNNPTGNLIPRASLVRIAGFCARRRAHLVVDESFIEFTSQRSLVGSAVRQRYLTVVRSFTKFFALPGLRIGYLVAPRSTVEKFNSHLEPWSVNTLAMAAAAESMKDSAYRGRSFALVARERQYLSEGLAKLGWLECYPSEANFLLVRIRARVISGAELRRGLESSHILIRDSSGFRGLGPEYVRIAVRTRKENTLLLEALRKVSDHFQHGAKV